MKDHPRSHRRHPEYQESPPILVSLAAEQPAAPDLEAEWALLALATRAEALEAELTAAWLKALKK